MRYFEPIPRAKQPERTLQKYGKFGYDQERMGAHNRVDWYYGNRQRPKYPTDPKPFQTSGNYYFVKYNCFEFIIIRLYFLI